LKSISLVEKARLQEKFDDDFQSLILSVHRAGLKYSDIHVLAKPQLEILSIQSEAEKCLEETE